MRIRTMTAPPSYRELEEQIAAMRGEKEAAIEAQEFEKAANLRDKERKLSHKKLELEEQWKSRRRGREGQHRRGRDRRDRQHVDRHPRVQAHGGREQEAPAHGGRAAQARSSARTPRCAPCPRPSAARGQACKDPKRPTGSFIFLGPSGVGKTELARTLAEFLFGDEDHLVQLDMSEYMEKHSVSRLVGSPPGYVGHEEGGQLTEIVRRKPYSVVLLDEVEKAHPDVFNILLQILEDGRLTDAQGRAVDFRNTILIMTSNIGAETISKNMPLGFVQTGKAAGISYTEMKARITSELKKVFRPEFLNRVDEVIVFHKLSKEEICTIVDLLMASLQQRIGAGNVALQLTDAGRDLLVEKGYDPTLGARPLRRAIQRYIEDKLADAMLEKPFPQGTVVVVDSDGEDSILTVDGQRIGGSVELPLVGIDEPATAEAAAVGGRLERDDAAAVEATSDPT